MRISDIAFYITAGLSFVAWLLLLVGAAVLGASCAPLCRYFIGVPALIICWQALVLLLCTFIQVFSWHGGKVLALAHLAILTSLSINQASLWLNNSQGLNGMYAPQNSVIAGLVMLSMLDIALICQLGAALTPPTKPTSSVGVQMASSA